MEMKLRVFVVRVPASITELTNAACGSNCLNNTLDSAAPICNEITGECLYGCIAGYAGQQCQIPCGDNCLNCIVR